MSQLDDRLHRGFAEAFGGAPEFVARAPGRVNLIGEHTDYNDGFAMPVAVSVETRVAVRSRDDGEAPVAALDLGEQDAFDLSAPIARTASWRDYVRGVIREMGVVQGVEIAIAGNIPRGTGLSSSASLEIALILALQKLRCEAFDPIAAALLGQRAENDFVGVQCGNLDQIAVAATRAGHALLIDCRSLALRHVPLPPETAILIVQSGVERGLLDGAYNDRRAECEAAARILDVLALRDADLLMLNAARSRMPERTYRRARHVITENARTLAAAEALAVSDYATLGTILADSQASMRDDFEITVPESDALAAFMNVTLAGAGGARQTGGGFGGAVIAITDADRAEGLAAAVRSRFPHLAPTAITIERACQGAS